MKQRGVSSILYPCDGVDLMSDLWYYTQNGQQAGPLSEADLKRLATTGGLKPTELVWKEGMPEWTRADLVPGLFPPGEANRLRPGRPEELGAGARRPRRDDDLPPPPRKGMSPGLIIALVLGGVLLLIILACGGVAFIAYSSMASRQATTSKKLAHDSTGFLQQGQRIPVSVRLYANTNYTIDLKSRDFDAFLELQDPSGITLLVDDDSGGGLDARIVFTPMRTGDYRIVVRSLMDGGQGNYRLTVRN
jgi:hypothetical protein